MMSRNHVLANAGAVCGLYGLASMALRSESEGLYALRDGVRAVLSRFGPPAGPAAAFVWWPGCAILFLIGSTLPDIDSPNSQVSKLLGFSIPIGHRTWTHSIWPCVLLGLLAWKLRPAAWLALGYAGHLFFDSFSVAGVCWFYPISRYITYPGGAFVKKGHVLKFYHAGDASETVFLVVCLACSAACLFVGLGGQLAWPA